LPFDSYPSPLQDILESIDQIAQFTSGMDIEAFRSDPRTMAAVERKLQIISEAAVRLGERAEEMCPGLPWRDIRGIGNWLRHEYFKVDIQTIWKTAMVDLPALRASVLHALRPPPGKPREPSL
jgi:uncharacterized protein with HEPN domain